MINSHRLVNAEEVRIFKLLAKATPGTKEYNELILQLADLTKSRDAQRLAVINVGGKIVSILIVLYFERSAAVISKAFGLVRD